MTGGSAMTMPPKGIARRMTPCRKPVTSSCRRARTTMAAGTTTCFVGFCLEWPRIVFYATLSYGCRMTLCGAIARQVL